MRSSPSSSALLRITLVVAAVALGAAASCSDFKDDLGVGGDGDGGDDDGDVTTDGSVGGGDGSQGGDAAGGDGASRDGTASDGASGGRPCTQAACPPVTLAGDLHVPAALAVDATYVYWLEAGNGADLDAPLVRIPKTTPCLTADAGCRGVLDPTAGSSVYRSYSLGVGPDQVCYTQTYNNPPEHSVYCIRFGGAKRGIYQGTGAAGEIVPTADTLTWVRYGTSAAAANGALFSVRADAGFTASPPTLATNRPGPDDVAVDGTNVFWSEYGAADAGTIQRALADGGARTAVATGQVDPRSIALSGAYVVWVNVGDGTVHRTKKDGSGPIDTLATGQTGAFAIEADATTVYWLTAGNGPDYIDGALRSTPLLATAGTAPITMMDQLVNTSALAIDGTDVYVATSGSPGNQYTDGKILRIAKTY